MLEIRSFCLFPGIRHYYSVFQLNCSFIDSLTRSFRYFGFSVFVSKEYIHPFIAIKPQLRRRHFLSMLLKVILIVKNILRLKLWYNLSFLFIAWVSKVEPLSLYSDVSTKFHSLPVLSLAKTFNSLFRTSPTKIRCIRSSSLARGPDQNGLTLKDFVKQWWQMQLFSKISLFSLFFNDNFVGYDYHLFSLLLFVYRALKYLQKPQSDRFSF